MNLWSSLRSRPAERDGYPIGGPDAFAQLLNTSLTQTLVDPAGTGTEAIGGSYASLVSGYSGNGIVFSCMSVRQHVFSGVRFQYQRLRAGRPSELWGDPSLSLLEAPWRGGTTQDLLARMIQDVDLAGNSYWFVDGGELVRMRPDWVEILLEPRLVGGAQVGWRRLGYQYTEGGPRTGRDPAMFLARDVAHFAPIPDPTASYRGMTWLTPIVREVEGDQLMGRHKRMFFSNGATPNMIIKHAPTATPESVKRWAAEMERTSEGVDRAYKTLHIGGGADATVVGKDLQQIAFTAVQGHGETRVTAAAGVPAVIVGLSEGLQAATYSNFGQARRRFADGTMHPLWGNAAGSLAPLMREPSGSRLWYDSRDVPFLREDEKDSAEIAEMKARTIRTYVDGGFTHESSIAAVESGDEGLLVHTGFYSVQLQQPGTNLNSSQQTTVPVA